MSNMQLFDDQNRFQLHVRKAVLEPEFYARYYPNKYMFCDGPGYFSQVMQQIGVDTIVMSDGGPVSIQEKCVRYPTDKATGEPRELPYDAYCFETIANVRLRHPGWARTCDAMRLLYAFIQRDKSIIAHLIDWHPLRDWFWKQDLSRFTLWAEDDPATRNSKEARIVPFREIPDTVKIKRFHLAKKIPEIA
jgi:hypothetical protein